MSTYLLWFLIGLGVGLISMSVWTIVVMVKMMDELGD
jgi:hypothetical protein